ncbi:Glucan endo-1,3-alpha-glucosidase agn1 [Diaporthe eres]
MPAEVVQDKIFYSALLSSAQQVTVTVGGVDLGAKWTHTPSDPVGIYHGSVAFGSNTGPVKITVGGMVFTGESITTLCTRATGQDGLTNFNAWVGSQSGGAVHATPTLTMSEQVCIEGTGAAGFSELCEFTCQYSYCPPGACYCTKMGPQKDLPTEKDNPLFGTVGYPAAGLSADYSGLSTEVPFSNVEITTDARNGFSFQPTPSIVFPPIGYPITIVSAGTSTVTTRSVTLPPWPFAGAPGDPAETTTNTQNPDPTGEDEPPASTSAAVGPLPVWKTWPPSIITPVTDDIKDIGPVEDATGTAIVFPCNIWFMNTVSASICSTTTSYGLSADGQVTKTTATSVMSTCETVLGCEVSDYDSATATAVCSNPQAKRQETTPRATPASATSTMSAGPTIAPRQNDDCEDPTADILVYMSLRQWSDAHVAPVVALLEERGVSYKRFRTDAVDGGYTPFLHVNSCPESLRRALEDMSQGLKSSYEVIPLEQFGPILEKNNVHGTVVAACAASEFFGIAAGAKVILVETGSGPTAPAFIFYELQKLDVSIVTSAGNEGDKGSHCDYNLPQLLIRPDIGRSIKGAFGDNDMTISNLVVVGATDVKGKKASFSETFQASTAGNKKIVYAPGENIWVPDMEGGAVAADGTSYAAPIVAGLIAYWRGVNSGWDEAFKNARALPKLARVFQRPLNIPSTASGDRQPFVWNGQDKGESCLTNGMLADDNGNPLCPEELRVCSNGDDKRKRQSCDLGDGDDDEEGSGSSGGDSGLRPSPITWQPGTPSPTCSSNCGSLCSGYYCKPNPTGNPPDYSDPKLHPATSVPAVTTSVPIQTSDVPTATSNPVPSVTPRVPSRDARWDLFHMAVTLDSGSLSYTWVGNEDDQSQTVEEYLENNSKCNNPDWMGADKDYPTYPASLEVTNFFGAYDCKFVFQVASQSEWLGLDSGEWLGNVICTEYDYAECFKDTDKTFYSCDDLDAYRTRWAYCTWDHWFTKTNTRTAALSRLAAIRKLQADNGTSRLGLETDGTLSVNMTNPASNGTANLRFL